MGAPPEKYFMEVTDRMMTIDARDIAYEGGRPLWIRVKGFDGNENDAPEFRTQVLLEYYENQLRIVVWNKSQDPVQVVEIEPRPEYRAVLEAKKKNLPTLIHVQDPDAMELLQERMKKEK